ncbi:MAG: hypothetical protein Q8O55_08705 [Dehalococcoidales bacterium]|nr:hypothetical protein [Dehalococcoidales bacterium]
MNNVKFKVELSEEESLARLERLRKHIKKSFIHLYILLFISIVGLIASGILFVLTVLKVDC